jgi:hypothetical protein
MRTTILPSGIAEEGLVAGLLVEKLRATSVKTCLAEVLRLRAIKPLFEI